MPNQEIGVKSIWDTKQFSRGLNTYLRGLTKAIAETNNAVSAINNFGSTVNNVFGTVAAHSKTLLSALQAITNAAKAASAASAKATGRGTPKVQVINNPAAGATVQQINAATNATRNLGTQAKRTSGELQNLTVRSIAAGTAIGTIAGNAIVSFGRSLTQFGSHVLEIVTFFERLELSVSFFAARSFQAGEASLSFNDALAAGAKEAQGLLIWLQRLAVASPFTTRDVGILFRTAQAYGLTRKEAEQLTPLLLDFAAAAGLDEDILQRLALAMGQVRARGKLTGEEVRQLGNSGIPIRDILVKALGIANEEFDELLESGAFTSDVVIPAIIDALKDFEGAGERVAFGTIGGIVSAFQELREIGIAKFFIGLLEPLKKGFQDLFAVLNQPRVLAFAQVLGQELGVNLRNGIASLVASIQGLIGAWQALDPVMQQQIIVFAAATAGALALIATFGLLTAALGVLLHPVTLIATSVGFLVSEWTSGFAVLRSITSRTARAVGSALNGIVRAISNALNGLVDFLAETTDALLGSTADFVSFGFNIGASLAKGIIASGSVLAGALGSIGNLLSFWLAPGSPPRIAPDIDDWGQATMEEYIEAFGNANVKKSLGDGLSIVSDTISQELIDARKAAVDRLNAAHPDLNLSLVDDLQRVVKEGYDKTKQELANTDGVEAAAAEAGIRVSDSFVDSFLSRIPALVPKMSEELQEVLGKIGGGARLTRQGALSFNRFLSGFGEADFGVLDEVSGVVEEFLSSLVNTGQIEEVDLPRLLFGAREDLAQGIKDIEETGAVTQSTMQRIRLSAGGASAQVLELLSAYAPLRAATEAAEAAQNNLNAVTDKYKALLAPLRKELEAINEVNKTADEEEKILSLRRTIANQAVSDRRRTNAQNQIQQIFAERRVRGLERERDAATEVAEDELKAREKTRDALEKQFGALQANIQAQLTQLGLFSQEASIIRKLREEAEKLREKELTAEQLQLKFLELQGEELSDLIEAARAKHTLEDETATLLEKEEASIKLAEIALRRRNREAEAIKLGIPVEELTKLRDFEVTLDDIGVKTKEAFEFEGTGGLGESLVDANKLTEEWERTLADVKKRWQEIKDEIKATATAINENLPSFLKIFPEEPGGEPPIIGFIKSYAGAIVGLIVVINTLKVIARLAAVATAIRNLATFGTLTGGAAAAGGGAAAAGGAALTGAAAVIAGITSSLIGFTAVAGAFIAAAEGVDRVMKALDKNVFGGFIESQLPAPPPETGFGIVADTLAQTASNAFEFFRDPFARLREDAPANKEKLVQAYTLLPDEAQPAKDSVVDFLDSIADDEAKRNFATSVTNLITAGVATGLTDAQISNQVMGAFSDGVALGLVADTEENRAAIATFATDFLALVRSEFDIKSPSGVSETEIGVPIGQGILNGIKNSINQGGGQVITTLKTLIADMRETFEEGKDDIVKILEELRVTFDSKFIAIRDIVTTAFRQMRIASETEVRNLRKNVVAQLAGEKDSLLVDLDKFFIGKGQLVPKNIGRLFIEGIAIGITENKQTLADAMIDALQFALIESSKAKLEIASPSGLAAREIGRPFAVGIAQGILDGIGLVGSASRLAAATAMQAPLQARFGASGAPLNSATTTNVSRTNHYHLNVKSSMQSQGVINDFGIMRTLNPA